MAKAIMFTDDELRTICWAMQCLSSKKALQEIDKGKKPSENETWQRMLAISNKAYGELIDRHN